jgi:hypothetical protein
MAEATAACDDSRHRNGSITASTPIKVTVGQWIGIIGLLLVACASWLRVEQATELFKDQNAQRSIAIEKQREIIDRLTLVCERLSIREERTSADLSDALKRIRDVEKRVDRTSKE